MPKLKPAKAKKKKRQIAEQTTKRPVPVNNITIHTTEDPRVIAEQLADALESKEWGGIEQLHTELRAAFGLSVEEFDAINVGNRDVGSPQPAPDRFEEYNWHGTAAIIDQFTGFVASFGDAEARDEVLASGYHDAFIDGLSWTHIASGADAMVTTESEGNQYFLLDHEIAGLAVLDRYSQLVIPLPEDVTFQEAEALLTEINNDPVGAKRLFMEAEPVEEWVKLGPLVPQAEPEDDIDSEFPEFQHADPEALDNLRFIEPVFEKGNPEQEPVTGNEVQPGPSVLRVLVISSSAWQWGAVVDEQLEALSDHGKFNLVVITSGSPNGAEGRARAVAEARGWPVETIRDEGIGHAAIDYGVAFITNRSEGAERALAIAEQHRIPIRVLREQPAVRFDPWAGR